MDVRTFLYTQLFVVVGALVKLIVAWLGHLTRKVEGDQP